MVFSLFHCNHIVFLKETLNNGLAARAPPWAAENFLNNVSFLFLYNFYLLAARNKLMLVCFSPPPLPTSCWVLLMHPFRPAGASPHCISIPWSNWFCPFFTVAMALKTLCLCQVFSLSQVALLCHYCFPHLDYNIDLENDLENLTLKKPSGSA